MNRVAILGATGGIGTALARRLVNQGRSVFLIGRNEDKLITLADELHQPYAVVDLRSSQPLEDVLKRASEADGEFAGIVNCIGSVVLKPAHATSDDEFRQVFETNLFTSFAAVRAGGKLLRAKGDRLFSLPPPLRKPGSRTMKRLPPRRRE